MLGEWQSNVTRPSYHQCDSRVVPHESDGFLGKQVPLQGRIKGHREMGGQGAEGREQRPPWLVVSKAGWAEGSG